MGTAPFSFLLSSKRIERYLFVICHLCMSLSKCQKMWPSSSYFMVKPILFSDPLSWEQGPVLLICSSKISFLQDGNVSIKRGSIGRVRISFFIPFPHRLKILPKLLNSFIIQLFFIKHPLTWRMLKIGAFLCARIGYSLS